MIPKNIRGRSIGVALVALITIATSNWAKPLRASDESVWRPETTRVFIVSLAQFKGARLHSFSPDERLDDEFAAIFAERGVPAAQILFLKDEQATAENIQSEFTNFLRKSQPGETLFFYFGSHGSYDPETGKHAFCAYDENLSFNWALNAIERNFKGKQALLTTDCCYSGGMAELVAKRPTSIAYACLSSTAAHQTAWSGWRFMQCLMRGFAGNSVVDENGDGQVDLDELADYTARYMAFAAEGKPLFHTTGGFEANLRLASVTQPKDAPVGELLEVKSSATWTKAEILGANRRQLNVHFTKDTRSTDDAWVRRDQTRPFEYERYAVGSTVEVQTGAQGSWHSARVLENWESLHLCRIEGRSSAYDEWFGPSRIRAAVAGSWSGKWRNDVNESGPDTLVVRQNADGQLSGEWSGNIAVKGERLGNEVFLFSGQAPERTYRGAWRIEGGQLEMDYCAHRPQGHYFGWGTLQRSGVAQNPVRSARVEFAGNWTGAYENSRGGSGDETLELVESSDQLQGEWSGVRVRGERIGTASFYLEGKLGQRTYRIVGHVTNGELKLNYSATSGDERYFGWSTLESPSATRE